MAEPQGDSTTSSSADGAGGDAEDGGSDGPAGRYQNEIDRQYHCQHNHHAFRALQPHLSYPKEGGFVYCDVLRLSVFQVHTGV